VVSEVTWREFEVTKKQYIQQKGLKCDKWSKVKGFWSTDEIEYFQDQGLESDKWSEVKGIKAGWDMKCI